MMTRRELKRLRAKKKNVPDYLKGANAEQSEVICHESGPCRVLASAGSGKSFSIVRRIDRLVEYRGVRGKRICATTFSKKAAEVMTKRLEQLGVYDVRVGTWHSLCFQILREDHTEYADWDVDEKNKAKLVLKDILGFKDMKWNRADLGEMIRFITICKANLWEPSAPPAAAYAKTKFGFDSQRALEAYTKYDEALSERGLLTYDDFLVFTNSHLTNADNRAKWAARWDYLICDEVQDDNFAQERIAFLLAKDHSNYMAVGDVFQCIPRGQLISTPLGQVPIEDIRIGDEVLTIKEGQTVAKPVLRKSMTRKTEAFEFDLGEHGCFQATREHTLFAAISDPEGVFLYLMYRDDAGFRIGTTTRTGTQAKHFIARTQQEGGERLWVLDWFATYAEAAEAEAFLAYEFGVPREPFAPREGMWCSSQEATSRLFSKFGKNGYRLLEQYSLDFKRPNYFAKASSRGRIAVNILMATKDGHRVEVETNQIDKKRATQHGMLPTGKGTFRTRRNFKGLREARFFAEGLTESLGGYIVEHLSGVDDTGRRTMAVPASSVNVGMRVPIVDETGNMTSARVEGRRVVEADECFDLEVEDLATFIVNGVVVHNSIYGFRGSSPKYLANFEKDWPGARTIYLPRNYRSGRKIIEVANRIVSKAIIPGISPEPMVAEMDRDGDVRVYENPSSDDEANTIASHIQTSVESEDTYYSDHTILFRVNAQSRALEEAFLKRKIPYVVLGGTPFYERKEIRDLLAYLRVANGTGSEVDFRRCINSPFRFLGSAFVERLMAVAEEKKRPVWTAIVNDVAKSAPSQQRARYMQSAGEWADLIEGMTRRIRNGKLPDANAEQKLLAKPSEILSEIVKKTGYVAWLRKEAGEETLENNVAANVYELIRVSERFDSVRSLLKYIERTVKAAKQQRRDSQSGGERVLMMSIHRAKGQEWPHVYVVTMNEGLLPHYKGDPEEERRLAYVAVTRAEHCLYVSYIKAFATENGVKQIQASRFVSDAGLLTSSEKTPLSASDLTQQLEALEEASQVPDVPKVVVEVAN